ncbi:MAG: RNA polymerase sigma-70 factor (ECF subfamily) [Planctomycetota bacterium]|jgi:RNA polymerase sigma-70 factor (ECF subfamily)
MDRVQTPAADHRPLETALEALPRLVRACHSRLGRPLGAQDLEEAIQETGLAAWRQRDSFRGESAIETWLYSIARRTILHQINQRQRRARRESPLADASSLSKEGDRPLSRSVHKDLGRAVRDQLRLAGPTAEVIVRSHDLEGLSFGQIGANLSMHEATVKSRYYRALPGLKTRMRGLWLEMSR